MYVLGQFRDAYLRRAAATGQAEIAALLAEWKQDQAALAERFDRDRDGHVSLGEWEHAREEARRTVDAAAPRAAAAAGAERARAGRTAASCS